MQTRPLSSVPSHYQEDDGPSRFVDGPTGFFATHPVGEVLRSLFLSALLWVFLAFAIYKVYTMVLGPQ